MNASESGKQCLEGEWGPRWGCGRMAKASFAQVANTGEAWLPEAGGQRGDPGSQLSGLRLLLPMVHRLDQRPHPGQVPRGSGFLAVSGGMTPCVLNSSFSSFSSVASYPLLSLTCQSHWEWKLGGEMIKPEGKLYLWSPVLLYK